MFKGFQLKVTSFYIFRIQKHLFSRNNSSSLCCFIKIRLQEGKIIQKIYCFFLITKSSGVYIIIQGIIQNKSASGSLTLPLVYLPNMGPFFQKQCYFKVFLGKTTPNVPFFKDSGRCPKILGYTLLYYLIVIVFRLCIAIRLLFQFCSST